MGQAQNDQPIAPYIQKYKLRLELGLTKFDTPPTASKSTADKYFPVYCFHATRDAGTFSHPFIYHSKVTENF